MAVVPLEVPLLSAATGAICCLVNIIGAKAPVLAAAVVIFLTRGEGDTRGEEEKRRRGGGGWRLFGDLR